MQGYFACRSIRGFCWCLSRDFRILRFSECYRELRPTRELFTAVEGLPVCNYPAVALLGELPARELREYVGAPCRIPFTMYVKYSEAGPPQAVDGICGGPECVGGFELMLAVWRAARRAGMLTFAAFVGSHLEVAPLVYDSATHLLVVELIRDGVLPRQLIDWANEPLTFDELLGLARYGNVYNVAVNMYQVGRHTIAAFTFTVEPGSESKYASRLWAVYEKVVKPLVRELRKIKEVKVEAPELPEPEYAPVPPRITQLVEELEGLIH